MGALWWLAWFLMVVCIAGSLTILGLLLVARAWPEECMWLQELLGFGEER